METIPPAELFKAFGPILGVFGAALLLLVKIIDRLIPNKWDRVMEKIAVQMGEVHEAHLGDTAHDEEGRLKWWFPQKLMGTFQEILKTQKDTLTEIKGLNGKMDIGSKVGEAQLLQAQALQKIASAVAAKVAK